MSIVGSYHLVERSRVTLLPNLFFLLFYSQFFQTAEGISTEVSIQMAYGVK